MNNHQNPPSSTSTSTSLGQSQYIVLTASVFCLLLLISITIAPSQPKPSSLSLFPNSHRVIFHKHQTERPPNPPSLAYLISGSTGDSGRMIRLLHAIYHPKNQYILHLERSTNQTERDELAVTVQSVVVFCTVGNVHVIGKADYVFSGGPTSLSATLHGASLLLKLAKGWDWFVNLDASDYPLVSQDDLLHILSYLPRDLNFVNHTNYIGWRESRRLKPIVVDPALFLTENINMFYATQKRPYPGAFRLFTGSSSVILSRKLIEFCILGTDNFPRTLLMYLSNTPSATSTYFPTVLCNTRQFNRTTINHSLRYTSLDSEDKPRFLNSTNFDQVMSSGAAFASHFLENDEVLDRIDRELLGRNPGQLVPGGWCLGESRNSKDDKCRVWGDADVLRPGQGAKRLEKLFVQISSINSHHCIVE